jgi:hypothetical protein
MDITLDEILEWVGPTYAKQLILGAIRERKFEKASALWERLELKSWTEKAMPKWDEVFLNVERSKDYRSKEDGQRLVKMMGAHLGDVSDSQMSMYLGVDGMCSFGEDVERHLVSRIGEERWSKAIRQEYRGWLNAEAQSSLPKGTPISWSLMSRLSEKELEKLSEVHFWNTVKVMDRWEERTSEWTGVEGERKMAQWEEKVMSWCEKWHQTCPEHPTWSKHPRVKEKIERHALSVRCGTQPIVVPKRACAL